MKRKQIQTINILVSDKRCQKPFSDYVNAFHLNYVKRQLNQMPLSKEDKLKVIEGILQNIKTEQMQDIT